MAINWNCLPGGAASAPKAALPKYMTCIGVDAAAIKTPLPYLWSVADKCAYVDVDFDGLKASYCGPGKSESDAASIRANNFIPLQCGLFYFEITIVNKGRDGHIGVGVCSQNVSLNRLPGWEMCSYGYHGDDGYFFCGTGNGKPFGPTYTTGDVVGCGIDFINQTIFYTKNGVLIRGPAAELKPSLNWYPVVGFRTPGEAISANFGGRRDFCFDIASFALRIKYGVLVGMRNFRIDAHEMPHPEITINKAVLEYLIGKGFSETAQVFYRDAFERSAYENIGVSKLAYPRTSQLRQMYPAAGDLHSQLLSVRKRKEIIDAVYARNIDAVLEVLNENYNGLLEQNRMLFFRLHVQNFVELLRKFYASGASAADEGLFKKVLAYGNFLSSEFKNDPIEYQVFLDDLFSIVAYANPELSADYHKFFSSTSLENITAFLNAKILEYQNEPSITDLEKIIRHNRLVLDELAECDGAAAVLDRAFEFN